MALVDEFEKSGNWLFRWRSYLPLTVVLFIFLVMSGYKYIGGSYATHLYWEFGCFGVSLLGLFVRCVTIGFTPKGTSGRNTKGQVAEELNTGGIYSVVRHPLYLGNFLMGLGLVLFTGQIWFIVSAVLAFWLYYERIMFAEEAFLRGKFGRMYDEWAAKTNAFIPRFNRYESPRLEFSLRNVLRREYNGLFAVTSGFFLLEAVESFITKENRLPDSVWSYIFAVGLIIWVTLRSLKKYTKVLNVSGR
jgi:lipid A Kdo2 1-phosphate O-methyltransferase